VKNPYDIHNISVAVRKVFHHMYMK